MKVQGMSGNFFAKALVQDAIGWHMTDRFFFTLEEVKTVYPHSNVCWPVEAYDNSIVYVPHESELQHEN